VPPVVERCYQGGNFTNYPFSKPVLAATLSPYNKYCNVRIKTNFVHALFNVKIWTPHF
jgi:hypothetical protein